MIVEEHRTSARRKTRRSCHGSARINSLGCLDINGAASTVLVGSHRLTRGRGEKKSASRPSASTKSGKMRRWWWSLSRGSSGHNGRAVTKQSAAARTSTPVP
eukprot:2921533-Pyramimonas_sp.AAC.1